jgi:uncharacterized protein
VIFDSVMILMAKQPQPGKTKTRLSPPLTPQEAALLYEALLKDSLDLVSRIANTDLAVAVSPPGSLPYFREISPPGALLIPIEGENVGVCLERSFQALFEIGYRKGFAIHTDGPSIPAVYLEEANQALDKVDLVIGPGEDGGYYLIGMKQPRPELFQNISWSTGDVLTQSLAKARFLNLTVHLTPVWYDVDFLPDLLRLHEELEHLPADKLVHSRIFFQTHLIGKKIK